MKNIFLIFFSIIILSPAISIAAVQVPANLSKLDELRQNVKNLEEQLEKVTLTNQNTSKEYNKIFKEKEEAVKRNNEMRKKLEQITPKKMPSLPPQTISINNNNNNTTITVEKRNSIPKKRSDADLELETNAEIDKQNIEKEIENILN